MSGISNSTSPLLLGVMAKVVSITGSLLVELRFWSPNVKMTAGRFFPFRVKHLAVSKKVQYVRRNFVCNEKVYVSGVAMRLGVYIRLRPFSLYLFTLTNM